MTTTQEPVWRALLRLEHAELADADRNLLRPAFAVMHVSHAMQLPERVVARIRHLDATLPKSKEA
ncbi:hypothetical protein [Burkholderia gladioli]|uniref:hypothetical protein n=1 Tax=Burkholderia gladioli TaxID=28095 RepID=UPI001935DF94|nr:hypothetical protein [Burkholderia gladioli]MBU9422490.1 hypothetical protein [Burkholderia gladioli]MDN8060137.1 hypothetical protein [Burkholderia gladioli]QPQ85084.1 hypothetical protein I6H08_08820 [Burkholderia gladioli]